VGEVAEDNPHGFDVTKAHSARVYDYWLGGKDNFAVDRKAAEKALAANPGMIHAIHANRAFLVRAVRYLASDEVAKTRRGGRWAGVGQKPIMPT
jgi:hypothetical protein